jgi:hypothetical protein
MKTFFVSAALLLACFFSSAQNVQLHYDFGSALYPDQYKDRPHWTTTVENFRPDKWGNTFFFIDMDYTSDGVASAYWEISRELGIQNSPLLLHAEYNGGLNYINNAYLCGLTYTRNSEDFSSGYSIIAMYKYIQKNESPHNFQLTGVWHLGLCDGLCDFTGFADFWREKSGVGDFVFLAEPQFWCNLNQLEWVDRDFNLSVGSEWEVNYDFAAHNGFHVLPTLAIKWTWK